MPDVSYNPKIHYTLNQVSKIIGIEPYVLKYWKVEGLIELQKNKAGRFFCTRSDIRRILFVKKSLREDRYTIAGTLQLIKNWKDPEEPTQNELGFK
jgi:DNA-binding transcriptional MerR regulator